jgi:Protein of unknown function (DUF3014)
VSDLADLRLNQPPGPLPPVPPDRSWGRTLVLILVAIVAIVAGYLAWRRPFAKPAPVATVQQQRPAAPAPSVSQREPGDNIPLPPVDETDPLVRELVGKLSSHPKVLAWLATDKLVRNFTVVLVNVGEGHSPANQLHALALDAPFTASSEDGPGVITPASYRRYDAYADAFASLDARGSAHLYATLKPRIEDAYRDLGYPQGDVDEAVKKAIVELLAVPVIETPIAVKRMSVSYTYEDPKLETLSAAQKQLLRMGPRNVRLVQAKLREMAPYLGVTVLPSP